MRIVKKNRFQLEQAGRKSKAALEGSALGQGLSQKSFRIFMALMFAFFLISVIGASYYYLHKSDFLKNLQREDDSLLKGLFANKEGASKPEYRYYMPQEALSSRLRQALSHYQAKQLAQASLAFEEIIKGKASDKEKEKALVYLGIIAMERGRYALARHQFLRALRYEKQSLGAIVNLAILENLLNNYNASKEYALQARKLAPRDKQVLLLLGNLLLEEQDADRAISSYEQAIGAAGDSIENALIYYNLGLSHLQKNNLESAIENFKKALSKSKANKTLRVRAQAHLGQLYLSKGNLNLAVDYLRKAVELAPENAKYLYNLGVLYLYKKEPVQAEVYFKRALEADESSPRIYRSLAEALQRLQKPALAIRALEQALYINPGDLPALFQLGDLQHKAGELEQALISFRKIVNMTPGGKNTQKALRKLALLYWDMERHSAALTVLQKAIAYQAVNPRAYLLLGKIQQSSGRRDLAIAAWKKALRSQSSEAGFILEREEEREIRLALGDAYRREGAFEQALRQYELIKERNAEAPPRTDPYLYLEWAKCYSKAQDFKAAIPLLQHVITLKASSRKERKRAFVGLAESHAKIAQNPEHVEVALNNVNKALHIDPQDPKTRLLQASLLMQSKTALNKEKALEVLKVLSNSEKNNAVLAQTYNLMGMVYMENGEYRRALSAFSHALQLEPSNKKFYRNQQAAANAYETSL